MTDVVIDGGGLSIDEIVAVARDGARAVLSDRARSAMQASRDIVDELASSGLTGLRRLDRIRLARGCVRRACEPGPPAGRADPIARRGHSATRRARGRAGDDAVAGAHAWRWLAAARGRCSLTGCSTCSPPDITPRVPEHGSLGCSGDLAPLAHVALVLLGEGEVVVGGDFVDAAVRSSEQAGIEPIVLEAKEGLALVNGTDGMLGMLALACHDVRGSPRQSPTSPRR